MRYFLAFILLSIFNTGCYGNEKNYADFFQPKSTTGTIKNTNDFVAAIHQESAQLIQKLDAKRIAIIGRDVCCDDSIKLDDEKTSILKYIKKIKKNLKKIDKKTDEIAQKINELRRKQRGIE